MKPIVAIGLVFYGFTAGVMVAVRWAEYIVSVKRVVLAYIKEQK